MVRLQEWLQPDPRSKRWPFADAETLARLTAGHVEHDIEAAMEPGPCGSGNPETGRIRRVMTSTPQWSPALAGRGPSIFGYNPRHECRAAMEPGPCGSGNSVPPHPTERRSRTPQWSPALAGRGTSRTTWQRTRQSRRNGARPSRVGERAGRACPRSTCGCRNGARPSRVGEHSSRR